MLFIKQHLWCLIENFNDMSAQYSTYGVLLVHVLHTVKLTNVWIIVSYTMKGMQLK